MPLMRVGLIDKEVAQIRAHLDNLASQYEEDGDTLSPKKVDAEMKRIATAMRVDVDVIYAHFGRPTATRKRAASNGNNDTLRAGAGAG